MHAISMTPLQSIHVYGMIPHRKYICMHFEWSTRKIFTCTLCELQSWLKKKKTFLERLSEHDDQSRYTYWRCVSLSHYGNQSGYICVLNNCQDLHFAWLPAMVCILNDWLPVMDFKAYCVTAIHGLHTCYFTWCLHRIDMHVHMWLPFMGCKYIEWLPVMDCIHAFHIILIQDIHAHCVTVCHSLHG